MTSSKVVSIDSKTSIESLTMPPIPVTYERSSPAPGSGPGTTSRIAATLSWMNSESSELVRIRSSAVEPSSEMLGGACAELSGACSDGAGAIASAPQIGPWDGSTIVSTPSSSGESQGAAGAPAPPAPANASASAVIRCRSAAVSPPSRL